MKTDLLPPAYTGSKSTLSQTPGAKGAVPLGKIPGQEKALPGGAVAGAGKNAKDYHVELSDAAKKPPATPASPAEIPDATPAPELPSMTPPNLPKAEVFSSKAIAQEEAKDKAIEQAKKAAKIEAPAKKGSIKKPMIAFISGWQWMSSPSKSEGSYAGLGRIAESIEGARLYGWDQKEELLERIEQTDPDFPVILVGHSFGGDTAVEVANDLDSLEHNFRKVDLLVTLDSVGFNNDIIPQNVAEHLNVFGEKDVFFMNDGPHVARRHEKTNVTNILSPLAHTELDDAKDIQFEIVSAIDKKLGRKAP